MEDEQLNSIHINMINFKIYVSFPFKHAYI